MKNERTSPFIFGEGRTKTTLQPGQSVLITDDEYAAVPIGLRGVGGINSLWPNQATSDSSHVKLEYFDFGGGSYQVRYLGMNENGAASSDGTWTVKRFDYVNTGATDTPVRVADIQTLSGSWDDRASLPWI